MAAPRDKAPIWARPEPGTRRPRFSREQIAAVALKIADEEGFDAVSMRRIAAELGAGTMTLYHYVRTKDELVALMDDALMASTLIPAGELPTDWRAAISMVAEHSRRVLAQHPWSLVSLREAALGPNAMRHFEQSLQALQSLNLDIATKMNIMAIVDEYVFGHVLRADEADNRESAADQEWVEAAMEWGRQQLGTGEFPLTTQFYEATRNGDGWIDITGPDATRDRFDTGLQALLDGLAIRFRLPD